jgi:hypothetical protein
MSKARDRENDRPDLGTHGPGGQPMILIVYVALWLQRYHVQTAASRRDSYIYRTVQGHEPRLDPTSGIAFRPTWFRFD